MVNYFSLLIAVFLVSPVLADETADLDFIRGVNPLIADNRTPQPKAAIRLKPREISELKLAATGLIRLYQKFISSQDGADVQFPTHLFALWHGVYPRIRRAARHSAHSRQAAPMQRFASGALF